MVNETMSAELKAQIDAPVKQVIITFNVDAFPNSGQYLLEESKAISVRHGLDSTLLSYDDTFANISLTRISNSIVVNDMDYFMATDEIFEKLVDYTPKVEIRTEIVEA